MFNSQYFKELDEGDKGPYRKKLTLASGITFPDPYGIAESKWKDDVLLLPDITHLDLIQYLIDTPSEFTKESLKAYKSLEAYNFFLSGHVQDVFHHSIKGHDYCFIKSHVLPSQRQGITQKPYQVWCCLHNTAWILSANCTCMAG